MNADLNMTKKENSIGATGQSGNPFNNLGRKKNPSKRKDQIFTKRKSQQKLRKRK